MDKIIVEITSTAITAITIFGIIFCFTQTKYSNVNRSFAAFLAVVAINNTPDAFARLLQDLPIKYIQFAELIIWTPSNLCLAPSLWVYVYILTSSSQQKPRNLHYHFLLPALSFVNGLIAIVAGREVREVIFSDISMPLSPWSMAFVLSMTLLYFAAYLQIIIYIFLIIRRLMRYRLLLRDVYSSTEKHELRWIYVMGGLSLLFWLSSTLILLLGLNAQADSVIAFASIIALILVATTMLWGLRQRPPLVYEAKSQELAGMEDDDQAEPSIVKYEKSALNAEISSRISRKLRVAMDTDQLYRNPNLSLWALSRHIGASPNYVSQTLNEVVGESFFDFVNGYRIAEAATLLTTTNQTILTITHDVGFNARSSFYNAFKRVKGQTPTSYRKIMSNRNGPDDNNS